MVALRLLLMRGPRPATVKTLRCFFILIILRNLI